MYEEVGENGWDVATPSCEMIPTWVSEVYGTLDQEISKNAWKKRDMNGFSSEIRFC